MTSSRHFRSKGSTEKIAGGGCVVLFVGLFLWYLTSQTPPVVQIPTPTLPSPNAFDTFQSASAQLLESKKIDNALYTPEGAKEAGVPALTFVDREKLMAENAQALATLRTGLDQSYWNPPARSFYTLMPYYAKFRGLARFLAVDAGVLAAKGDYGGASRSSLDAIAMGAQIPHGSTLLGSLVGISCQAIGRKPLWKIVAHLDASQAREAARRLEKIQNSQFSYAETLQEEKWACQAALLETFRRRNPAGTLANVAGMGTQGPLTNPAIGGAAASLFYLVYSKQRIMNDYTTHIDAIIARAKQPYSAQRSAVPVPNDPFVMAITPFYEHVDLKWTDNGTQTGLLEVTLALRAYKLRHGAYPDSLAQLAPEILHALPTDPFTAGKPYCYRRAGTTYLLYSVGPDGKDDGGRMINSGPSPTGGKNKRYLVKPDSTGDIVAGKNIW